LKPTYVLVILGCVVGTLILIDTFITADSAPKQGAGAALAVAFAVIPYCFVRAIDLWDAAGEKELRKLNEMLATHTRLLATLANAASTSEGEPKTDATAL
jgi:hypothetical protein